MNKLILLLLITTITIAQPVKNGNSTHYKSIQLKAANIYEAETNVPIVLSGSGLEDVIAGAAITSGHDIVVTDIEGIDLGRTLPSFNKLNNTLQLHLSDPAIHAINGGTRLFLQWGGDSVANDITIWQNCHGSTSDYALIMHGESIAADLVDASGNYSITDSNILYNQEGKILKAPKYVATSKAESSVPIIYGASDDITVLFWLKSNTIPAFSNPVSNTTGSSWNDGWGFYNSGGNLYFWINNYTGSKAVIAQQSTGTFTHVAGVYNHSTVEIYKNGIAGTNAASTSDIGHAALTHIGKAPTVYWVDGILDEVRIFRGALSADQVKTQYDNQNGFTTNATITIGTTSSFTTTKKKAYQNDAYPKNYQRGAYAR